MNKTKEILHFWFEETSAKQKYEKNEEFDNLIRTRFLDTYESIVETNAKDWRDTPEDILAAIVVLDQFSRNMFRDDAKSIAADSLAVELADLLVDNGKDMVIDPHMRSAIYMPYMHSESKEVHRKGLEVFQRYADETGDTSGLEYEVKHKKIIDTFGRYPHRNEVLGRQSTPGEEAFNKKHGGF